MKKHILIVEDDYILGSELIEALEEDYDVTRVLSGSEAFEKAEQEHFDLCILDYKLDDMDGGKVVKKLKNMQSACKVIIISGRPFVQEILEQEQLAHLIDEIIQKPFDPVRLFKKIDRHIA